jgi:antitoxin VapB
MSAASGCEGPQPSGLRTGAKRGRFAYSRGTCEAISGWKSQVDNIYSCYISMKTAKIFWSGRSQAVRLPKNFRFEGHEVRIRRHGNAVILEPLADNWQWLDAITEKLDDDFVQAVKEQPGQQDRPELEKFFRQ